MTVKDIAVARTDWLSWLLRYPDSTRSRDFVTHRPPGMVFDDDIFPTNKNRRYKRECIANTMKKPNKRREGYLASRVGKVHWRRGRRSIARGRRSRSIAACGSCRKASGNLGTSRSAEPTAAAEVVADWCRRSVRCCCCSNCCCWPVGSRTKWPMKSVGSNRSICFRCCFRYWKAETTIRLQPAELHWLSTTNSFSTQSTFAPSCRNLKSKRQQQQKDGKDG